MRIDARFTSADKKRKAPASLAAAGRTKKEAVGADGGPIPPAANRFDSSVYGRANCCRTTRFANIIALPNGETPSFELHAFS